MVEVVLFRGASMIPRASELHRDGVNTWKTLTRCPICKRHSADTRLSQLTLEQFVMNIIGGLRRLRR
jgi:hypothetical protein